MRKSKFDRLDGKWTILVAARSKAWICGSSLAGSAGSNPTGCVDVSLESVVCCQAQISALG
jgi:hypothetical protein